MLFFVLPSRPQSARRLYIELHRGVALAASCPNRTSGGTPAAAHCAISPARPPVVCKIECLRWAPYVPRSCDGMISICLLELRPRGRKSRQRQLSLSSFLLESWREDAESSGNSRRPGLLNRRSFRKNGPFSISRGKYHVELYAHSLISPASGGSIPAPPQ